MIFVLLAMLILFVYVIADVFWVGWLNPPTDGIWGTLLAFILTLYLVGMVQLTLWTFQQGTLPTKTTLISFGIIWFIGDWLIRAPNYFGIMMRPPKKHDEDFEDVYR